jgi:hypothetical protein
MPIGTFAAGGVVVVVVVDGAGGLVVEVVVEAAGFVVVEAADLVVEVVDATVDGATVVDELPLAPAARVALPKGQPASSATALVPATRTAARQRPLRYNHIGIRAWHTPTGGMEPTGKN